MTHGYYLALTRTRHGDPLLARLARLLWRSLRHFAPSRVDGVSIFEDGDGYEVMCVARDFFSNDTRQFKGYPPFEVPRVHVRRCSTHARNREP